MRKKNAFLTFCFACVPGCGQMYQGYMKRGVSLLFWMVAIIAGGVLLNLGAIIALCIVIWAYSFFDTFNIRNLSPEQRAVFYDDYIPSQRWLRDNNLGAMLNNGRANKLIAWVLIGIGALTLYQNFLYRLVYNLLSYFPILWDIYYAIPRLVIGLGVVLIGIRMLRRAGVGTPKPQDDDVTHYIGDGHNEQN